MPETSETPEEPQQGPPSIEEGPKQRPTGADSTPGGVGAPLGTETYETQPLPALDALLQTSFLDELPPVKGLKDLQPHAESHEPIGDDYIMALGEVLFLDHYLREYTKAGMADAVGDTILFSLSVSNAKLEFGWGKAKRMGGRTFKESTEFPDAGLWDSVFMGISKSHTGTPAVQPDMDNSNVSNLYLKAHDITEVRRLEFTDTDQGAGNNISLQQRGDAAGAILEVVNDNDATQYSSPTYRRIRLADPVGADDATTKRYVDALSYAGHALLDGSLHTDTLAAGVTDGSIVIGNVTPKWSELVISIPAADVRNVLGVDNGELRPSWKAALDATNPVNAGGAAAPGTSLIFSHRDHVHAVAASHSGSAHHAAAHDHTGAADGGVLTNDEHDGYSQYDEIAAPGAGGANKLRIYIADDSGVTRPYAVDTDGDVVELAGYTLLDSVTLGAAAQTLASFTNIPAKFRNLRLVWHGESNTNADALRNLGLRFNADAGANYDVQFSDDGGAAQVLAQTFIIPGRINGTLLAFPTWGVIDILNYADPAFNRVVNFSGGHITAGNIHDWQGVGMWNNAAAAINRVDIFSENAATQFLAGSVAYLYGY